MFVYYLSQLRAFKREPSPSRKIAKANPEIGSRFV